MIGQFLSNTNESATVSILQKNLELNKAQVATDLNSQVFFFSIQKKVFFSKQTLYSLI